MNKLSLWLACLGCVTLGGWALYSALFYAWLTATPITDEQLHMAQTMYYVCMIVFGIAFLGSGWLVFKLIKKKSR